MERNSAKSTYIYRITALELILYEITLKISLHMCIMWPIASVVIYEIDGEMLAGQRGEQDRLAAYFDSDSSSCVVFVKITLSREHP